MLDPTVRFETGILQPGEVNKEKQEWYKHTVPVFKEKLRLKSLKIIGLFIGARGTITKQFVGVCQQFGTSRKIIDEINTIAIRGSCQIYFNHVNPSK